jgi:transaldolase
MAGVDLEAIARQLETEGLDAFASSFDDLLATLASKAASR